MVDRNTPVPVTCLDKPRSLLYTLNAAARIKQSLGENPLGWNKEDWTGIVNAAVAEAEPRRFLVVLHALLAHEDGALTVEQLGEMVSSLSQMRELFSCMALSYAQFIGPVTERTEAAVEDPLSKAQTPISSGQSDDTTSV